MKVTLTFLAFLIVLCEMLVVQGRLPSVDSTHNAFTGHGVEAVTCLRLL